VEDGAGVYSQEIGFKSQELIASSVVVAAELSLTAGFPDVSLPLAWSCGCQPIRLRW
jgi:hypothetical protein